MTQKQLMLLLALSVIALCGLTVLANERREKQLVIVGTVAGYDQFLSLVNLTSAPQVQLLIVRVEKRIKGREESRYIKVIYKYGTDEPSLPEEIFNGKSQWRFTLTRDHSCDCSVREMQSKQIEGEGGAEATLPRLKRTNATEEIPNNANLPCYALRPSDLKPASPARPRTNSESRQR